MKLYSVQATYIDGTRQTFTYTSRVKCRLAVERMCAERNIKSAIAFDEYNRPILFGNASKLAETVKAYADNGFGELTHNHLIVLARTADPKVDYVKCGNDLEQIAFAFKDGSSVIF